MKVIFLGTPDFAVATLEALIKSKHEVLAVVSQPDRAKDRKGNLIPTPVKQCAIANGIKLFQFEKIRARGVDILASLGADIMVTAAYGQILSKEILSLAPYGVINVHASLLPKYRGSAPIQWAVINGEKETGITIMQTDVGVDNGDIISSIRTSIGESETAGELTDRLKTLGASLLVETLDKIEKGDYKRSPQNESEATKCRMLLKEDGYLDFKKTSRELFDLFRGVTPFPGAFAKYGGERVKVGGLTPFDKSTGESGKISVMYDKIIVNCADGAVSIDKLQLAGGKMMSARDFLRGHGFPGDAKFD